MERAWRGHLNLLLLLLISGITTIRCSSQHETGTQDSGGGSAFYSKPEQVNSTLDRALSLATEPDPQKNIFVQFWKARGPADKREYIKTPAHLFPNATTASNDEKIKFASPFLAALKTNKISRIPFGDCSHPAYETRADASVSSLNVNAELCFSVGNLSRIPPSALLREILSLVLHETLHMGGAQEPEAIAWQESFSAYFGSRFGDLVSDTDTPNTMKIVGEAKDLLNSAQGMAAMNPANPHIFAAVGDLSQKLASLPDFNDPLALQLKINPKHPELIDNYSNSVLALIQEIQVLFVNGPTEINAGGIKIPIEFMKPDQVVKTLNKFADLLDKIKMNFLALNQDQIFIQTFCVLPMGKVDLSAFHKESEPSFDEINFGPAPKCAGKP